MRNRSIYSSRNGLPQLQPATQSVLNRLASTCSRRSYRSAIEDFVRWYCASPKLGLDRNTVRSYVSELELRRLAASTINARLAAVRALAAECHELGLIGAEAVAGISRVTGPKRSGTRVGNWLSPAQSNRLLSSPDEHSMRGKRDRALLAVLLGCGLRRSEAVSIDVTHLHSRDGRWLILNLVGKGNKTRTVPVPHWVIDVTDEWIACAGIESGSLFRAITRTGEVSPSRLSDRAVWNIVHQHGRVVGLTSVAPHDLRRTCAQLCFRSGGALEQIQFLLGHSSARTTERYLGCQQELVDAVNDALPLEIDSRPETTQGSAG